MKQNKLDALEALRIEKEDLREECSESEANLTEHWEYVRDNIGSLLLSSAIGSAKRKLGFGGSKNKVQVDDEDQHSNSKGWLQGLTGGLFAISPFIWEIIQPMMIDYGIKKVKSIFSRKKKKSKD